MSETYMLNRKLTPYRSNSDGCLQFHATTVPSLGFPLALTLSCVEERKCYKLEWQPKAGPLVVLSCMFKLVDPHGYNALESTITGVYLPAGQVGSVSGEGSKRTYSCDSAFSLDVELHCKADALRTPAEFATTEREFKLAQSTFVNGEPATTSQVAQDVALVFPTSQRVLWATANVLTQASPYLKKLLESSFSEGSPQTSLDAAFEKTDDLVGSEFDDSDDENDTREVAAAPASNREPKAPFKLVRIAQTSYTTYAAVLVWIFSPSHRLCPASLDESHIAKDANLPAPASPKSVYRLAHLLGLDALAALALENLKSQLTPKNASYELYSDVACCYPAVRDIVLAYVVEHWNEVGKSKAAADMQDKAEQGELPVGTAMMLAVKLADRQK
ncbi:hypothetical protein JCM10296v2_001273 [Rhodotorula toruloides]